MTDTGLHEPRERLQKIVRRFESAWPRSAPVDVVSYTNTLIALMMVEDRLARSAGPATRARGSADKPAPERPGP